SALWLRIELIAAARPPAGSRAARFPPSPPDARRECAHPRPAQAFAPSLDCKPAACSAWSHRLRMMQCRSRDVRRDRPALLIAEGHDGAHLDRAEACTR